MYVITGTNRVQKKSKKLRSEKSVQGELKMVVRRKNPRWRITNIMTKKCTEPMRESMRYHNETKKHNAEKRSQKDDSE